MTLSFQQQIHGKPNHFIAKIWAGLMPNELPLTELDLVLQQYYNYSALHKKQFGKNFEVLDIAPKIHTIRQDPHNRWRAGMDIHFVINNRQKNRFQFAPVLKCKSVQSIEIKRFQTGLKDSFMDEYGAFCSVAVGGNYLNKAEIETLAVNDGFESAKDFFRYFNSHFVGNIIHWTDLRY